MSQPESERVTVAESAAREAWSRGDMEGTATLVYEAYGAEIYSFLLARLHNSSDADEVFSQFNEDFWRALPAFEWRCSIRGWCYKLARSAASRYRRIPFNQRARRQSAGPWFEAVADRARTSTRPHMITEVKDEFQRLREKLSPEDRDLLILRIDRNLPWRDIAHVTLSQEQPTDDDTMRKKEAALRQQFTELKKRLKLLAVEAGLLEQ